VGIAGVAMLSFRILRKIQCNVRTESVTTRAKPLMVPRCPMMIMNAQVMKTTKVLGSMLVFISNNYIINRSNISKMKGILGAHHGSTGLANLRGMSFEMAVRAMIRNLSACSKCE
jgi:hypothetical protein